MKRRRAQPQVSISIRAGAKISGLRDEKLPFAGNAFQSVSSHVFEFDAGHHRANVVGALFEGGHFHWPIGKPAASLVESDQAAKSAEPLEEERTARNLPVEIEVRHGSWRHDQVDGTVARDLVGDQHIITTSVLCLGQQLIYGHGVGGVVSSARLANICNGPANCASSRFPYG
jgi:hypothetical protein